MAEDEYDGRLVRAILRRATRARACPVEFFDFAARGEGGARVRASAAERAALLFASSFPQACVRLPPGSGRTTLLGALALWSVGVDPEGSGVVVGPTREAAEVATQAGWDALGGEGGVPRGDLRMVFPELRRSGRDDEPWGPGAWTVRRGVGMVNREPSVRAVDGRKADLARAHTLSWVLVDDFGERDREGWVDVRRWFGSHVASRWDVTRRSARCLVLARDAAPDDLVAALERAGWPTLSLRSDGVESLSSAPAWTAPGLERSSGGGYVLRSEPGDWRGRAAAPAGLVHPRRRRARRP
jgi:hypothetical protein